MTFEQFTASLSDPQPPAAVHPILKALWYDANEQWEEAHEVAQSREGDQPYDRLHAYLHRKEGDRFNANYWYRRAGTSFFDGSLADEWQVLVTEQLG
ncbi:MULTISPECIES: hypothetical protein [Spirosoma]|uniref:Uncharacterized protein n=1 Tax=Spirosoma sordidisoli TaxID=2502893 RepID=A0A4Q2ULF5_9BACT|nr:MULTISPECIES: hypothetical protein [Spirosoma]RYC70164.1 hypothetical protein EQG79_09865 [Spirosoma sordidisoli]